MDDEFIINQLINSIIEVDNNAIKDVKITKLAINDKNVLINNKKVYWDQRMVPGKIVIK
ncbi:MAG: hypothetical protein ACOCP8_07225 [archaeon]